MRKKADLLITESLSSLKKSLSTEKSLISKRRIQSFVFIKEGISTRQHLVDYL